MPIDYGTNNITSSGIITGISGVFTNLTVGGSPSVTGTGIASHIAYWNSAGGIVADSGQLCWDATNNRLGLGIVAPSSILDISQNDAILKIGDASSNAGTGPRIQITSKYVSSEASAYLGFSFYNNKVLYKKEN